MKILSPYKDYYDFLQGVYGIDEKIVYERIPQEVYRDNKKEDWKKVPLYKLSPQFNMVNGKIKLDKLIISICGIDHIVFMFDNQLYYGQEGGDYLADNHWDKLDGFGERMLYDYGVERMKNRSKRYGSWWRRNYGKEHLNPTDINEKYDCPIILTDNYKIVKNVRLTDFNINKYIPAEEIYIKISQFLTRQAPVVDNRTDIEKLQSHGFDKVTSFRNL